MINVTQSYLPDRNKFKEYIDKIFESTWLTNNGPLVQELEKRLADYLGVRNILLVANGTLALQIAYRVMELRGEVITTPFTFAATSSSLTWEGLQPVYADICPETFNISPTNIEREITELTSAILPVHVFGNACEVEQISELAERHNLKVIYDASHAFNVKRNDDNILNYGDISTLSFHATKLFHTVEGGALIINDDELFAKARSLISFGMKKDGSLGPTGINCKMNEFQAAMGLCILDEFESIHTSRRTLVELYRSLLTGVVALQHYATDFSENYAYFPVVFKDCDEMLAVDSALQQQGINSRRYFFPSLDDVYGDGVSMEVSRDLASRILCLPLYAELQTNIVIKIAKIIKTVIGTNK